jgi:hypothetical protein
VTSDGRRASDGRHAVNLAKALSLERSVVASCLAPNARAGDATFETAFVQSLAALRPAARRGALAGVTGHVAESVTEIVLEAVGWTPVWHFAGPGRHGVDLLFLGPGEERLFAVEVKGTLRPHHWPRMRRGELTQMDLAWLDKADNPAMGEWAVTSDDVYGAYCPDQLRRAQVQGRADPHVATWHAIEHLDQLRRSTGSTTVSANRGFAVVCICLEGATCRGWHCPRSWLV